MEITSIGKITNPGEESAFQLDPEAAKQRVAKLRFIDRYSTVGAGVELRKIFKPSHVKKLLQKRPMKW
jgi:hypothetical protein